MGLKEKIQQEILCLDKMAIDSAKKCKDTIARIDQLSAQTPRDDLTIRILYCSASKQDGQADTYQEVSNRLSKILAFNDISQKE